MHRKEFREVVFYKDYYLNFFKKLNPDVKKKFDWTLLLLTSLERIPEKYLKHITDYKDIYEVRIEFGSNIYRIFCFFDKDQLIILLNSYQKKTQKIPKPELELAIKLRKEYYHEKNKK